MNKTELNKLAKKDLVQIILNMQEMRRQVTELIKFIEGNNINAKSKNK